MVLHRGSGLGARDSGFGIRDWLLLASSDRSFFQGLTLSGFRNLRCAARSGLQKTRRHGNDSELPRPSRVERRDGLGADHLRGGHPAARSGTFRTWNTASPCGCLDPFEHCGGARERPGSTLPESCANCGCIPGGTRHAVRNRPSVAVSLHGRRWRSRAAADPNRSITSRVAPVSAEKTNQCIARAPNPESRIPSPESPRLRRERLRRGLAVARPDCTASGSGRIPRANPESRTPESRYNHHSPPWNSLKS
jgi:hypothetical protein